MSTPTADVLVIGGGPAGSTVARELARQGWSVLVVDKARFPRPKTCGDGLTPRAVATLRGLGLETTALAHAYPVTAARLWASPQVDVVLPFDPYVRPLPPEGYVLPRRDLDVRLLRAAQAAGARVLEGARAVDFLRQDGRVVGVVAVRAGRRLHLYGRVTVVATGAATGLLQRAGLLSRPPHAIRAVRGYWDNVRGLGPYFEFFFLPEIAPGYVWIFPAGEGRANVGLGVYAWQRDGLPNLQRLLLQVLREHPALAPRFREARPAGPIAAYPIRTDFPRQRVWGWGWLAVGEAAGLVNPVTGEGIDLALESGVLAARWVDRALRQDPVTRHALRPYARAVHRTFAATFRGLHLLGPYVMRPRALRVLIRQAQKHPGLAARIMGITLGTVSPWTAFLPRTWWWLLR